MLENNLYDTNYSLYRLNRTILDVIRILKYQAEI